MGLLMRQFLRQNSIAIVALVVTISGTGFAVAGQQASKGVTPSTKPIYACIAGEHKTINLIRAGRRCPSGQRRIVWNVAGDRGERGSRGLRGLQGAAGAAGAAGAKGDQGPAGPDWSPGNADLTGPIGPTGATGPIGPPGPVGDPGPTGPTGQ